MITFFNNNIRFGRQIRSKDKNTKTTVILLSIGLSLLILFALMYKNWLYGTANDSWPLDDLGTVFGIFILAGFLSAVFGVGKLI